MIRILLKRLIVKNLQSFLSPNPTIIALFFEILILKVYKYLNFNVVLAFSYIPVPPLWVKHQSLYLTLEYLFFLIVMPSTISIQLFISGFLVITLLFL